MWLAGGYFIQEKMQEIHSNENKFISTFYTAKDRPIYLKTANFKNSLLPFRLVNMKFKICLKAVLIIWRIDGHCFIPELLERKPRSGRNSVTKCGLMESITCSILFIWSFLGNFSASIW